MPDKVDGQLCQLLKNDFDPLFVMFLRSAGFDLKCTRPGFGGRAQNKSGKVAVKLETALQCAS